MKYLLVSGINFLKNENTKDIYAQRNKPLIPRIDLGLYKSQEKNGACRKCTHKKLILRLKNGICA